MDENPAYIYHFRLSVDNEGLYMGFTPLFAVAKSNFGAGALRFM